MKEELGRQLMRGTYVPISVITYLRNITYPTVLTLYKQRKISGISFPGCPLLVNLSDIPFDNPYRGRGRPRGSGQSLTQYKEWLSKRYSPEIIGEFKAIYANPNPQGKKSAVSLTAIAKKYGFSTEYARQILHKLYY